MKNVDVIIVSYASNTELYKTTKKGLDSLFESDNGDVAYHAIIVESNLNIDYDEYNEKKWMHSCKTIYPTIPFNYNAYLNLGIKEGNSPYVALCNSDLTYEKDWASNIIKVMEEYPNIKSASPWCPAVHGSNKGHENNVYLGYEVRNEFCGWCIFQQRSLYETIGMLNEGVKFWYSDNILAEELKLRKIDHVLVSNSVVNHHDKNIGKTADTLSNDEKLEFTNGQYQKFIKEYQKLKQKLNINI
jgi:hypothetical protein